MTLEPVNDKNNSCNLNKLIKFSMQSEVDMEAFIFYPGIVTEFERI